MFFVYDNQRVCVTAPCPSYTVITPGAARFDVARVIVEREAEAAMPFLTTGGILVNGAVEDGSWNPGEKGPGLHIESTIEPAESYLVARHPSGAAAPYAVVTAEEMNHHVDRIDLQGFVAADIDASQTLATLITGQWATKGFVGHDDTGEVVLFSTTAAGASYPCRLYASGIECVTHPCPVWSLESMEGMPLGYASELELGYMHLPEEDSTKILDQLYASGGAVYGWLAKDYGKAGSGDVLLVVRVLELPSAP